MGKGENMGGGARLKIKVQTPLVKNWRKTFFSKVSSKKSRHCMKKIKVFRRGCHYRSFEKKNQTHNLHRYGFGDSFTPPWFDA